MSSAINFDTLQYAKKLKRAGMDEKLAEAQAEALAEFAAQQNDQIATKNDLEHSLSNLEQKLIIKFGAMLFLAVGALAAIIKL